MTEYTLVIGNKNYSSWSLRPWLAMAQAKIPFNEVVIGLRQDDTARRIRSYSPTGKVPVLCFGETRIWESLAILEYLADAHPETGLWPQDRQARAHARAVSAEMHAGFSALRTQYPMDLTRSYPGRAPQEATSADIRRIVEIWRSARDRHGADGPFLFGGFCAADAMFAPVASRFKTYEIDLAGHGDDGTCAGYIETIFSMPEMQTWWDDSAEEIKRGQVLYS